MKRTTWASPAKLQSQILCFTHIRTHLNVESGQISHFVTLDNISEYNLKIDGSIKNYIMIHMSRPQFILNECLPTKLNIASGFSIHLTAQALCC